MKLRVAIPLLAICLASPAITSGEQAKKGRGYSPRESGGGQSSSGRSGGGTATRSGGDNNRGGGERTATSNNRPEERRAVSRTNDPPPERRAESRAPERTDERRTVSTTNDAPARSADSRTGDRDRDRDRDNDGQRYAVPRNNNHVVNSPRIVSRRDDYRGRDYYRGGRNDWPRININIGSSYRGHYAPVHYDYWARRYYRWSPIGYAPWSLIYGSIGFPSYGFYGGVGPNPFHYGYNGHGWAYGSGFPPPYGAGMYQTWHEAGGVRLKIRPRDAQVFVDGHYAGVVDDFDGLFQSLKLEAGGHKIEIHMPGFEDLELDVHVQPGRTITLNEDLRPRP
jgi:hypothetical protein